MATALLIVAVSVILFAYWFRYVCLLIVHTRRTGPASGDISTRIRLNYIDVAEQLEARDATRPMDRLELLLESDYHLLRDVLRRVSLENRLLICNYHVLRVWFHLTRWVAPRRARRALLEIAAIVRFLAASVSEESVS